MDLYVHSLGRERRLGERGMGEQLSIPTKKIPWLDRGVETGMCGSKSPMHIFYIQIGRLVNITVLFCVHGNMHTI